MKKLVFVFIFVFGVMSSSQSTQNVKSVEAIAVDFNCSSWSHMVARYVEDYGGNYWEGYWSAMSDCVRWVYNL